MQIGSPEWISQSVQQLERLEQQRDAHEAALGETDDVESITAHASALAQLESQIDSLYSQLDAVATEDGESEKLDTATEYASGNGYDTQSYDQAPESGFGQHDGQEQVDFRQADSYYGDETYAENEPSASAQQVVEPLSNYGSDSNESRFVEHSLFDQAPSNQEPTRANEPDLMDDPFAMPAARPSQPLVQAQRHFASGPEFETMPQISQSVDVDYMADMDDFEPTKSGKSKLLLAGGALTVIAAIVGFANLNSGGQSNPDATASTTASATTEPVKAEAPQVIQAVEVPPDTEAPRAAVGAPVDRTPSIEEEEVVEKTKTAAKSTKKPSSSTKSKSRTKRSSDRSKRDSEEKPKNKRLIELSDNEDPMG